ncbi:MAG: penicillin-binding protein 2 [Clostridiales bacterium]|nr:penicillin-binding protein 2 [Clostridiales bacterium]
MREMRRNLRALGALIAALFLLVGGWFGYTVYSQGSRWLSNQFNPRLNWARSNVAMGEITDRTGLKLAVNGKDGERQYAANRYVRRALSQVVGDPYSMSGTGVETFHAGELLGFSGSIIDRTWLWASGENYRGDDIRLTIDAELSSYVSRAFPGGYQGAVAILNYRSGEILCMVSKPDYDPQKISTRGQDNSDSAYLNRCTQGQYAPGSAFKIVTLAAALQNLPGIASRTFTCEGERMFGDTAVRCAGGAVHGELTLKEAFAKSCNITFASLGYELGEARLASTSRAMGFDDNFKFADLMLYESDMPDGISTVGELAWTAVGQGRVLVTPLHMAMIAGSVAGGGVMMAPRLVDQVIGATGLPRLRASGGVYRQVMDASVAATVREYMRFAVTDGTAKNAGVKGVKVCGKTGSAQVSDAKDAATNAWFVGFVDEAEYPYAIAVVVEKGGAGSDKASKLAAQALKKAIQLAD